MITSNYRWRSSRIFRAAVILSILVHLVAFFLVLKATGLLAFINVRKPPPEEEITVARSSAIKIEKRPKPVPVPRPQPVRPRPKSAESQPRPAVVPQDAAAAAQRSKLLHELAKVLASAPRQPKVTQKEKEVTQTPTAPPVEKPKKLAYAEKPAQAEGRERSLPQRPTVRSQFSEEQLAKIENDLSKTIAQSRADTNPLIAPRAPAAAPRRYAIQTLGNIDDMRMYAGVCYPIRDSWRSNGFNYYWLECNVQTMAGGVERQGVPWPVHFRPNHDPFNGSMAPGQIQREPVPGPDPGYRAAPGVVVSPEMRDYAHRHGVDL